MNNPHIYVIVPVYNSENLLSETMNSALSQPYKNISFVFVDDGSKDNSPALCDKYANDNENIYVIHQENQGVSAARNRGIDYILSLNPKDNDYIAFLDSDDLWAKDCLSADLADYASEDIICFQSCSMSFDASMCTPIHSGNKIPEIENGGRKAAFRYPFHFGAFLYKVSLFRDYNIRFDTNLKYNEDKVLQMQLLYLAQRIRYVPRMMYLYRKNPVSAMHKRPHGIKYYEPLINGWMKSDDMMKQFENQDRETLTAGYVLSIIYVINMAQEHYWYWGHRKELQEFLINHRVYQSFLELSKDDVAPKQYQEYLFFKNKPLLFKTKHMLLGLIIRMCKSILKIGFVSNFFYKREFSNINNYI